MKRLFLIPFFLLSALNFSQIRFVNRTGDFLINKEYSPATFIQTEPKLFPLGEKGFTLVWKDFREGNEKYYAQNFNASGESVDSNYATEYSRFYYSDNGYTLEVRTETHYDNFFGGGSYLVYGNIIKPDNTTCGEKTIAYVDIPWCGTGWMGIHEDFKPIGDGFVYFLNSGGSVGVKRSDENCNIIYDSFMEEPKSYLAANISGAVTSDNYYAMFYYQSSEGKDFNDAGVFGIFYDPDNNLLVDTLKIFDFDYEFLIFDEAPKVYASALDNGEYLVVAIDQRAKNIYYRTFTKTGSPSSEISIIPLNGTLPPADYSRMYKFFSSPKTEDGFQLFFSIVDGGYDVENKESYILKFNPDGSLFGQIYKSDFSYPDIGDFVYNKTGNVFFAPYSDGKDVFLSELIDFDFVDNTLVNDDVFGGNQSSPAVSIRNDGSFFAMWENEESFYGRTVNNNGELTGEEYELYNTHAKFFKNGNAIAACKRFCGSDWKAGYRILDSNLVSVRTELLGSNANEYDLQITGEVISGETALVELANNDSVFTFLVDSEGNILKEKFITEISYPDRLKIFVENENAFWVSWYNGAKKLDGNFNVLNEFGGYFTEYIGDDKFLFVYQGDPQSDIYFNILDVDHNVIAQDVPVGKEISDWRASILTKDIFLIVYLQNNNIKAQAFMNDGTAAGDEVSITQDLSSDKKLGSFAVSGDKVLFTWSDDRLGVAGYDIWGAVFDLEDLTTDVNDEFTVSEFELKQNYPNPFNPSTNIEFYIPQSFSGKKVALKVFNSIGKEVAVLADGYLSPGKHKAVFEGKYFASGVYLFSLQAGEKRITKKGILLK